MTSALSAETRALPLVAVVSRIPILAEALAAALDSIADVEHFPLVPDGTAGMLRYLRPDLLVMDSAAEVAEVEAIAGDQGFDVVLVDLAARSLRVLEEGRWLEPPDSDPSAEVLRNIILGRLFARRPRP